MDFIEPVRFVSELGPNRPPGLCFFRSYRTFPEALAARAWIIDEVFSKNPAYDVVIYRFSYDGQQFYSSRQLQLEGTSARGDEKHAGEPAWLGEIAFDVFGAPRELTDSPEIGSNGMTRLSHEVQKVYDASQMPRPGTLKP